MSTRRLSSIALSAPAKINLFLRIGPRRGDGYHSLLTVFQEISLQDHLRFVRQSKDISLKVAGPYAPLLSGASPRDNSVVRALTMARRALRGRGGVRVQLKKNIPIGAGLGGGSSDAAAALIAGWNLWGPKRRNRSVGAPPPILSRLARRLGADVPFFLTGGTAWASGIGDKLVPIPSPSASWLVVVYPRLHVSTAQAYGLLDGWNSERRRGKTNRELVNSFEPVIEQKFPVIRRVRSALAKEGCDPVAMSGSGSAVFGFARNKRHADAVRRKLSRQPWDVFVATTKASRRTLDR